MTMILAIAAIGIITFVMLDFSKLQEIITQPIFPGLQPSKSPQITKTPASHILHLPQQKSSASICIPNDTSVNATESKICGVPATIKANNATTTSVSPRGSSILSSLP